MSKQRIEIEVDVPEGWEIAEYRAPRAGEFFFNAGAVIEAQQDRAYHDLILRRVEPKKESRWMVGFRSCTSVDRVKQRDVARGCDSAAFIRIDYENGRPVSVALESVEGKE